VGLSAGALAGAGLYGISEFGDWMDGINAQIQRANVVNTARNAARHERESLLGDGWTDPWGPPDSGLKMLDKGRAVADEFTEIRDRYPGGAMYPDYSPEDKARAQGHLIDLMATSVEQNNR